MKFRVIIFLCFAGFLPHVLAKQFGPTYILQCPESDQLVKQSTLRSGNTIGEQRWSDGYAIYPMLPMFPEITRCDNQEKFFWVSDAKVTGEIGRDKGGTPQTWHEVGEMRFLSEPEYLEALNQGMGSTHKKEVYLRIQAWWSANEEVRDGSLTYPFPSGSRARDNLERLVKLLGTDSPYERIRKAEAFRELGRFEEAKQTLQATFPKQIEGEIGYLRELINKRDMMVKRLSEIDERVEENIVGLEKYKEFMNEVSSPDGRNWKRRVRKASTQSIQNYLNESPNSSYGAVLKELYTQAQKGNAKAQNTIGEMYLVGNNLREDKTKAENWFQKAAAQGNADALRSLGYMYMYVAGNSPETARDRDEFFHKAAVLGNADAQYELGSKYYYGPPLSRYYSSSMNYFGREDITEAKAKEWVQNAAAQGNTRALYFLGIRYFQKDKAKAEEWFQNMAAHSDDLYVRAQIKLGKMYLTGSVVQKDETKAAWWFQKAAVQGSGEAQFLLGNMYQAGRGVPRDEAMAWELYLKAAVRGLAIAQYNLGNMYLTGSGVRKDEAKAEKWFQKVAKERWDADSVVSELSPREQKEYVSQDGLKWMVPGNINILASEKLKTIEEEKAKLKTIIKEENAKGTAMVRIPGKNYELGKTEVTQGQWEAIMGSNPSRSTNCGDNCPVESVSWDDIQTYLQKLNARTGRQYRLPTEAEWEYACYGGSKTEYCGGVNIDSVAWYNFNEKRNNATDPVGRMQANGYGLYDMSGNVWEWMENCYDSSCVGRAVRGGSWVSNPQLAHAVNRINFGAASRSSFIGFRLARTLPKRNVAPRRNVAR